MHVIAAKAVAFQEALGDEFKFYCQQIVANASRLAEVLSQRGFRLVSGGTDNHLILVDLSDKGLTGAEAEDILERAGITVNKNAIPFDKKPPRVTSGIRIGTPAVTTRGLKEPEMEQVANFMADLLLNPADDSLVRKTRQEIRKICQAFPLYEGRLKRYQATLKECGL